MPLEQVVGPTPQENLLERTLLPVTRALAWLTGSTRQLNRSTFPLEIVPQINEDLLSLQESTSLATHELTAQHHTVRAKYEYDYFPFAGYRLLSLENQYQFMQLRMKIDEVLERDYIYNDKK